MKKNIFFVLILPILLLACPDGGTDIDDDTNLNLYQNNSPILFDKSWSFPVTRIGSQSSEHEFSIRNTGADLMLLAIKAEDRLLLSDTEHFEVTQYPGEAIITGEDTTFKIKFIPSEKPEITCRISITYNAPQKVKDNGQEPFIFHVTGKGEIIPAHPTTLTVTGKTANSIALAWTDASDNEKGFVLERKSSTDTDYTVFLQLNENTVAFTDNGLTSNTDYVYRIKAVNEAGASDYSNVATATTLEFLAAPSNLHTTSFTSSLVSLQWDDNSGNEEGFVIERKEQQDADYAEIASVLPNIVVYEDNDAAAGVNYLYRVCAFKLDYKSTYSNVLQVTTLDHARFGLNTTHLISTKTLSKSSGIYEAGIIYITNPGGEALDYEISTANNWIYFETESTDSFQERIDPSGSAMGIDDVEGITVYYDPANLSYTSYTGAISFTSTDPEYSSDIIAVYIIVAP